jgi:hypothetical protein
MTTAGEQPIPSDPQAGQTLTWEILEILSEPNTWLVQRVVAEIGVERTRHFLAGTLAVEAEGGLLVERGTRRRTPGGVFFYLVRNGVSPAERKRLWPRQRQKGKKRSQNQQSTIEPLAWAEREPLVAQALKRPGRASKVKVTVIGRPQKVVDAQSCVITVFQSKELPASLPKGLPTPSHVPTNYAVFIALKQWQKVAETLKANPADELIIEGHAVYEPKMQGMAVLAQSVTTKHLEQEKRAKRAASC